MDVIVRDANGNELFRSNSSAPHGTEQWFGLTGADLESADVAFTADYIVVTVALAESAWQAPIPGSEVRESARQALETITGAFGDLESLAETVDTPDGSRSEADARLAEYPDLNDAFALLADLFAEPEA